MSYAKMKSAATAFAKRCAKDFENHYIESRKSLAGANSFHHPDDPPGTLRQVICDGCVMVTYTEPFPDLPMADPIIEQIDYAYFLLTRRKVDYTFNLKRGELPSLENLKRIWIAEKRRCVGNVDERNQRYRLVRSDTTLSQNVVVNIEYLIKLMELTDSRGGEPFWYTDMVSPVYVQNQLSYKNGISLCADGCVMPMRFSEDSKFLNDDQESTQN